MREQTWKDRTTRFLVASMIPLGMILFGPLADVISIEHIFVICGVFIVLLTIYARYGLKLEEV